MKIQLTAIAGAVLLALPAVGQAVMDADGDGNVTMEELQAVYPDATETTFTAIDTDGDGVLSEVEIAAAVDAGILPS